MTIHIREAKWCRNYSSNRSTENSSEFFWTNTARGISLTHIRRYQRESRQSAQLINARRAVRRPFFSFRLVWITIAGKSCRIITASILIGAIGALRYPVASIVFRQAFATGALPLGRCAHPFATQTRGKLPRKSIRDWERMSKGAYQWYRHFALSIWRVSFYTLCNDG